jgi:hypothetical protein
MSSVSEPNEHGWLPRRERERLELIKSAEYAKKLFENYPSEEGLVLDCRHKYLGKLLIANDEERKIWGSRPYATKSFKILVKALIVAGENDCLNKPMDKEEFKELVSKSERDVYRGMVTHWLSGRAAKNIFKEVDGKLRLKHGVKDVWTD